jgi:hypothetical protein
MLRAINAAVEIFVIKRLSFLNLVAQSSIVSRVKGIVAILTIASSLTIAACSLFGPGEAVRQESGRTLYRAAEENPAGAPDVAPVREKVPGESR